ncbi:MAG: caspase domain-containing protein [Hyphomicrobiaceae bacterium]
MRLVLAAVLLWLATGAAHAKQVALVVGIARYEHVESLKNPQRDAAAIADRLRDQGFDVIEAFDADRFTLERAQKRFLAEARGADLALFYFAGHGIQLFDRNVLLVRDAEPARADAVEELGLDLNALMAALRAAGPVRTAFLIDACRNNPLGFEDTVALLRRLEASSGTRSAPAGAGAARAIPRPATRGLSVVALPGKGVGTGETLAFFAAQPGHVSFDGEGRNSYFVEALLEAFSRADRPLGELLRSASAYVRTVTKGEQVPQLVSDWTADVVLGRAEAAKVRYLNAYKAGASLDAMTEAEARIVGEAARAWPALSGTFIVQESQSFTDSHLAASDADKARAKAVGSVNGFAIDYDIDRDGRAETIGVYFRQTNVVMQVVDEGVSLLDTPCWDFDKDQVEAVEIALRDMNGDRRPEVLVHYQKEVGSWGTFCVLEYTGLPDLASARRASRATGFTDRPLFRTLLKYEGAWTVRIGADNSIETCAGSNCHTRSAFTFDGTTFRQTLDESDAPSPGKARPFRDQNEREANISRDAGSRPAPQPAASAPATTARPVPPPVAQAPPAAAQGTSVARWVAEVYLPSGTTGSALRLGYEPEVLYYGKATPRAAVLADKQRYTARWPRRSYRLDPASVVVTPAAGGAQDVAFEYDFEVADAKRTSAGRGRTRLTLRPAGQGYSIAREEGEVVSRR